MYTKIIILLVSAYYFLILNLWKQKHYNPLHNKTLSLFKADIFDVSFKIHKQNSVHLNKINFKILIWL